MVEQPDTPGPGEHVGPDNIQAEASDGPIPDGEMPGVDPRRATLELEPVLDYFENGHEGSLRRTGTDDDDVMRSVRIAAEVTEQRLDSSAHDAERETTFDPAQDDAGPQSDQN